MKEKGIINVLITGANGFIGRNLYVALGEVKNISIQTYTRDNTIDELEQLLKQADVIYHLAGVNRVNDDQSEFIKGNVHLTEQITRILRKIDRKPIIVMSSSIQATNHTPYGKSKKKAEEILEKYAQETDHNKVFIYRLTNVFGKWGKPQYNSVVASFCFNISRDLDIEIHDPLKEIELVYIDDVIKEFKSRIYRLNEVRNKSIYQVTPTYKITLKNLANQLYEFHKIRKNLILPDLSNPLTKALYSTYLSYLDQNDFAYSLEMKQDQRGSLVELLKSDHSGQIFISTSHPGVIRGNHYHHTKVEKFCVIKGKAKIKLRDIFSDKIISYVVTDAIVQVVDIPPGYTHSLENIGDSELIVLFWANEIFDPERSDTYVKEVENE
ncbi:polysaccharide biosynthesis C-terminal domain-containing protein [Robertmurraya andreesenii]|uniref:UDP-2-acetamido-2,6-beta-L-arabino-hexul-4-ose reductase n=1 Tax=Anoxybacillus andreesenii TaxID=1325932 RepID=A0ABT9V5F0_9BACL|nr:NAD-dependent epimerase/dehydratase family protein [Robertmurraya andreesenii]MDQ0156166.1 UDP-2-acetamido-2,6-beta-L-arabino-hexul-4-ose reductase [Robertmurraya andreesenii]